MKTESAISRLRHNLIELPDGRKPSDVVVERHDIVLLFDATKANPNGDPDTGNMPRIQPDSLKGLVTDVCLKRKIRNFYSLYAPDGSLRANAPIPGYEVFIRENAVLQSMMESPDVVACAKEIFMGQYHLSQADWDRKGKRQKAKPRGRSKNPDEADRDVDTRDIEDISRRAYRDALCRTYFDVRYFGGVMSTEGPLKGSFYGQIRGPLQFTFSESLDRVLQLDATITRCAVASEKQKGPSDAEYTEDAGNRSIGRKHVVNYGLYRTHIYFSPAFAAKTGFTYEDLDNFLFALAHIFRDDTAAGRAGMRVVGLVDFQHASSLGNEHAHKLFDLVRVQRTTDSLQGNYPNSLNDYCGEAPQGAVRKVRNGKEERATVAAHQIIWEIPACAR
jgi:CRISPR-associated protein Csd2